METYTVDYVTRGGVAIEIELPLGSDGRFLGRRYMTDSERRKLVAIELKANSRDIEIPVFHMVH